jgi:hypothetical protein
VDTCRNLAATFEEAFRCSGDPQALDQVIAMIDDALSHEAAPHGRWRHYVHLCGLHLHPHTPQFSIFTAISHVRQGFDAEADHPSGFIEDAGARLAMLWKVRDSRPTNILPLLPDMHSSLVD